MYSSFAGILLKLYYNLIIHTCIGTCKSIFMCAAKPLIVSYLLPEYDVRIHTFNSKYI